MNIGKALRHILLQDETLTATLGERVAPLVAGQNVQLPFCIYRVVNIEPVNVHHNRAPIDAVSIEYTIFSEDYNETTTIAAQVRAVLDYYCGTAKGVKIAHCMYAGSREDINEAGRMVAHTVFFTVHAKQLVTQTQTLAAVLSATATALCNARVLHYLQANATITGTGTAAATVTKRLAAQLAAYATATCAVGLNTGLAANLSITGTGTAAATIAKKLAAALNASATATLNVTVYQTQLLAANININATATAAATIYKQFAAAINANATGTCAVTSGVSYDADAQAFFDAATITDGTQKTAVNQLVLDLKTYGIWSKFAALYPMVGGTAATHKFNLKDPRDLDAAFRLTFSGGWTHSTTGALPNGTNGYADTMYNLSTNANFNSMCWGLYFRTNAANSGQHGAYAGSGTVYHTLWPRDTGGTTYAYIGTGTAMSATVANSLGLYQIQRAASNAGKLFKNGSVIASGTIGGSLANANLLFGARGNVAGYDNRQISFGFIGTHLTDTEAADFYTAIQAFQTTLTRNV